MKKKPSLKKNEASCFCCGDCCGGADGNIMTCCFCIVVVVEMPLVVKFVVLVIAAWIMTWPLSSFFVVNIVANVAEVMLTMSLVAKVPVIKLVPVIVAIVVLF